MTKQDVIRKLKKVFILVKVVILYLVLENKAKTRILKPPIFVTGCGHSGTTLLLAILGTHSKILDIPFESHVVRRRFFAARIMLRLFDWWAKLENKTRWAEKTPSHVNVIYNIFSPITSDYNNFCIARV